MNLALACPRPKSVYFESGNSLAVQVVMTLASCIRMVLTWSLHLWREHCPSPIPRALGPCLPKPPVKDRNEVRNWWGPIEAQWQCIKPKCCRKQCPAATLLLIKQLKLQSGSVKSDFILYLQGVLIYNHLWGMIWSWNALQSATLEFQEPVKYCW